MNIPENIICQQSDRVQNYFRYWKKYMEQNIEFWQIDGDLDIHTQGHCERVLMHALRIGDMRKVTDRQLTALSHASIFHDTRRKDNYLDTGHGARAAEYYKSYCLSHDSRLETPEISFLPEAYASIWYHDRDDELGEKYIQLHAGGEVNCWLEVYHIFKDADALDRLRLGTWCLDPKFLRTKEAKEMHSFAQMLVERTIPKDELEKTYRLTDPFRPES